MKYIYKQSIFFIVLFICPMFVLAQEQVEGESTTGTTQYGDQLKISSGESKVVRVNFNVTKLAVGSPDVAEAILVSGNQILINAINDGRTNLLLWSGEELMEEYEVIVGLLKTLDDTADDLKLLLSDIEGVEVKKAASKILLEGEVYSQQEISRINAIIEDIPDVVNLTKTSKVYNKLLAEEIQQTIGIDTVSVRFSRNGYILEGYVNSSDKMEYAVGIAQSYVSKVINALYTKEKGSDVEQLSRLVEIEVKVVDVNRDAFLNFANDFNLAGSITGSASTVARDQLAGNFSLSDSELRKLEEQGNGRVLLEHTLITESGREAKVFVGDEIPIIVSQSGGELSTEYRKVGVSLEFLPTLYDINKINLDVSVGSSTVAGENATGAPIVSNVEVSTSTYISNGVSMVLSGLVRQRQLDSYLGSAKKSYLTEQANKKTGKTSRSKNSFLGGDQDPNRFTRERREVLVVVKPTVINNPENSGNKIKNVIERSFKDQEMSRYSEPAVKKPSSKRIILSGSGS